MSISKYNITITVFLIILNSFILSSQENELIISDSIPTINEDINPLAPATAAFYSAVIPGLGQAYNKKYFRIPFVYAAIGTSGYFYFRNNKQYNRYRDAFQLMEAGKPHEFDGLNGSNPISRDGLIRAQERFKEDKELSLLITIGFYLIQIVEASVTAHLMQLNTDDNLTFNPKIIIDPVTNRNVAGISISYNF